ncbi:MAG: hypothetical protein KUG75_03720 [Pseudomonadales bacterium]|nr:hypothetical protein [Pseudomonadales bacterium]
MLETVAQIGEFLGGVGVIATMLFLAFETRRNSRLLQRDSHRRGLQHLHDSTGRAIGNEAFTDIYLCAFNDLSSLNPNERFQFDMYMLAWIQNSELLFLDHSSGFISEDIVGPHRRAVKAHLATPGGVVWWKERRAWFTAAGQKEIDRILNDSSISVENAAASPSEPEEQ